MIRFTGYGVIAEKLRIGHLPRILAGKSVRWIEKRLSPF